ncbi:MAG: hypothetical protein AB7L09_22090 [Nitrospira sp.]
MPYDLPEMSDDGWIPPTNYVDMVKGMYALDKTIPADCDPDKVIAAEKDYENYILGDGI